MGLGFRDLKLWELWVSSYLKDPKLWEFTGIFLP